MATQTSSTMNYSMGTAANWQALWGTVVDAFLTANGWTYVSQTGDGNPNTVSPGSAGSYACFRVYSTSVGSETWYMRLDFGYDSSSNGPAMKIQIGSGANGSGTLTGQTSTQQTITLGNSISGSGRFYAISVAAGRFTLIIAPAGGSTSGGQFWCVGVHGGVNGSGTLTSGVDVFTLFQNAYTTQNVPVSGTVPAAVSTWPVNQSTAVSNVIGSHTMTFHTFTWNESGGNNPTPEVMACGTTDFPTSGVGITTSLYGATRTFFSLNQTTPLSSNLRWGILYE